MARILQSGAVPTTFLRAAMILGSGGAAFEILRYLVDRLPVMLTPRWVHTPVQPIAIRNVLTYLMGCLDHDETRGQTFDIGGPEVVTYRQLMDIYAEEAHLARRLVIPVPVLTPRLSSYWIHLVTPVPASLAQPLAAGLANPVVCLDNRIREIIPQELLDCRQTIRLALQRIEQQRVETCWSDAGELRPPEWAACGDADYTGGTVLSLGYRIRLKATPEEVWQPLTRIGGATGWYYGDSLWAIRGWADRLLGGSGLRRGRRHPTELQTGDALDFFRVLEIEPGQRLLLLAEMKLPGEATLEFRLTAPARRQHRTHPDRPLPPPRPPGHRLLVRPGPLPQNDLPGHAPSHRRGHRQTHHRRPGAGGEKELRGRPGDDKSPALPPNSPPNPL